MPVTPVHIKEILARLNLPMDELVEPERKNLEVLVSEFADVFALCDQELGCTYLTKHTIDTGDHHPIRQQPYRTPVVCREVSEMVKQMQNQGVIQSSNGLWAIPCQRKMGTKGLA